MIGCLYPSRISSSSGNPDWSLKEGLTRSRVWDADVERFYEAGEMTPLRRSTESTEFASQYEGD